MTQPRQERMYGGDVFSYAQHRPEQTLLYQLIERYWRDFQLHMSEREHFYLAMLHENLINTSNLAGSKMGFCGSAVKTMIDSWAKSWVTTRSNPYKYSIINFLRLRPWQKKALTKHLPA